jgi:flagellar basal-body rod modification protein FlgD
LKTDAIAAGQVVNQQVSKDAGKDFVSKDGFLKILTAQMQNQDPLATQDESQMISQMAQFAALEQMQNLNSAMGELLVSQKFMESSMMIGKTAKVAVGDGKYETGVVTGSKLGKGTINIVIDGKEYSMDNVVELNG